MNNEEREDTINFIKDNIELIDKNNFKVLYDKLLYYHRGNLTSILLEANINPLEYMDKVPDDYAFAAHNIDNIIIPNNIKEIGSSAFSNCESLKSITIRDSVTSIGKYAFAKCTSLTDITIPDRVTSIGEGVFYNCTSLKSIIIPNSVTSISYRVFSGCTSLTNINYKGSKFQWQNIDKDIDWNDKSTIRFIHCTDGDIELPKSKSQSR